MMLIKFFSGISLILLIQTTGCMNHLDPSVSLEQVIATKDPEKIRSKVVSLWPQDLCTVYLCVDFTCQESPKLLSVGGTDSKEKASSKEIKQRKQQAQLLKEYLLIDVIYPALEGRTTAEQAMKTIDMLAGIHEGVFSIMRSDEARNTIDWLKKLLYNKAPQTFNAVENQKYVSKMLKSVPYFYRYKDQTRSMINFAASLDHDYAEAQQKRHPYLNRKRALPWVLGMVGVGIAGYLYCQSAESSQERVVKNNEEEEPGTENKTIPAV